MWLTRKLRQLTKSTITTDEVGTDVKVMMLFMAGFTLAMGVFAAIKGGPYGLACAGLMAGGAVFEVAWGCVLIHCYHPYDGGDELEHELEAARARIRQPESLQEISRNQGASREFQELRQIPATLPSPSIQDTVGNQDWTKRETEKRELNKEQAQYNSL